MQSWPTYSIAFKNLKMIFLIFPELGSRKFIVSSSFPFSGQIHKLLFTTLNRFVSNEAMKTFDKNKIITNSIYNQGRGHAKFFF